MRLKINIPSRLKPKPYLWHAGAVSSLVGIQLASDAQAFPRLYQVGPLRPFENLGNVPVSALIAMSTTYGALEVSDRLGSENYEINQDGRNVPTLRTKVACTAAGLGIGIIANSIVETQFGLSLLGRFTTLYANSRGIYGGEGMDLASGVVAAGVAGRVSASTFPSLNRNHATGLHR